MPLKPCAMPCVCGMCMYTVMPLQMETLHGLGEKKSPKKYI